MDDLYPTTLSADSTPYGYAEILSRIERIDEGLRKTQKKKKHGKKGGKKKLKHQLEKLQMENEQIKFLLGSIIMQQQEYQQCQGKGVKKKKKKQNPKSTWWETGLATSMPIVFNNLTKPKSQYLPERSQLCLSDGKDRR